MNPDATQYPYLTALTYREAVMALMAQEEISVVEVAQRMGVSFQSLYRYLHMEHAELRARPHRFTEQYLVLKMLDQDTRERIMQPHHWAVPRGEQ